jgi:hypothetical protein
MKFKDASKWDPYSDQPYVLGDKAVRSHIRRQSWFASIKLFITNTLVAPFVAIRYVLGSRTKDAVSVDGFFGMGISIDKAPEETRRMIGELGVKKLLIRFPLDEMNRLDEYVDFVRSYSEHDILINVLQDRDHVECPDLLGRDLEAAFATLGPLCQAFQIGNAVNRKKWAFFNMDEYLRFYQTAYRLRNEKFPGLILAGPSVIDFEYHYTIRLLFNFFKLRYDKVSTLLYVDRRGAPENKQMGFSLKEKINLQWAMQKLSPKCSDKIIITETNWPLSGTAPYAPTSEQECVDEDTYASFMVRYHLMAIATGHVETVYWHQLIAPGYGLVDNRDGIHPYKGYSAYKTMLRVLEGAMFTSVSRNDGITTYVFKKGDRQIRVLWSTNPSVIDAGSCKQVILRDGGVETSSQLTITGSPTYILSDA